MKKCFRCKLEKPLEEFSWKNKEKTRKQSHCFECQRAYSREWYKNNTPEHKKNIVAQTRKYADGCIGKVFNYLKEHPCVDCGETNPVKLEFDHVRGIKVGNIANMMNQVGWQKIEEEIAKCEVRCSNCHRFITAKRGNFRIYKLWQLDNEQRKS